MLPVEAENELPHLNDALGVQTVDGLIQDEKVRVPAQGHGNAQPLAHAQGEVAGLFLPRIPQAHQVEQFWDPLLRGQAQQAVLEFQIIRSGEVQIHRGGLHHRPHPAAGLVDLRRGVRHPVEGVVPRCGGLQAADQTDEGGFPRPVLPHEPVDGPLGHMHGQGLGLSVGLGQALGGQGIVHEISSFVLACP